MAGLSQAKVAQLIGKSPSTVRSWEMGRTNPSEPAAVSALAAVLGLDEPTLLNRAGFPASAPTRKARLQEEFEGLKKSDPSPIPPPPLPSPKAKPALAPATEPKPRPAAARHLVVKPIAVAEPVEGAKTEIPITVEPGPGPLPTPSRSRKVTPILPLAASAVRSYMEDEEQRQVYRWRNIITLICLFFLFLAFGWAVRNMGEAISDFVGGFVDALNF